MSVLSFEENGQFGCGTEVYHVVIEGKAICARIGRTCLKKR
jgi:hypothetical protein